MQRPEPELNQDGAGNGHGRAKTGDSFDKGAKGKGDQDYLDPRVGRQGGQAVAQHLHEPALERELVQKDDVEEQPPDGEQPKGRAIDRGRRPGRHGHPEHPQGYRERDSQAQEGRQVNAHAQQRNGPQQHRHGQPRRHG